MQNTLYLRYKNKVFISPENNTLDKDYLLNLLANIESLGYTLSKEVLTVLATFSERSLDIFYVQLIKDLKTMLGAYVEHNPMYKNFPKEVKKMSEAELYNNAFMHYLGDYFGIRIMPESIAKERKDLADKAKALKIIDLGSIAEYESIFINLVSAKTSISDSNKEDIVSFIQEYNHAIFRLIPNEIPHKENTAFLLAKLLQNNIVLSDDFLAKHSKTATDILRIAVAISNGDVSLAKPSKFISFPKAQRRFFLQRLEAIKFITEDMLRYKEVWKRLGERLHPSEYKSKYAITHKAFEVLRNDLAFETFNNGVETNIAKGNLHKALELLKTRPGELARRLDHLLRISANVDIILKAFDACASAVATPVLLQIAAHFKARNKGNDLRIFMPKGNVSKIQAINNNLPVLEENICKLVVDICNETLIERFKSYAPLGTVYLDKKLKNYTVPLSQRTASKALVTIPQGSRMALAEGNTIRLFVYWKQDKERIDIDLSALALDSDFKHISTISYYNLKEFESYHSGDITSAPNGASEFIDINIKAFLKENIRYLVMNLNSFTEQAYCDLPICFAGFMMRKKPNSGEIFEAKTVEHKFDISADSTIAMPLIIDLEKRAVIWTDLSLEQQMNSVNNVHNNLSSLSLMVKAMTENWTKPNLYDLLKLHVKARGEKVENIEKANTIFSETKGVKPSNIDVLISEYL